MILMFSPVFVGKGKRIGRKTGAKRFFPEKKIAFSPVRCYIDMMHFFQP